MAISISCLKFSQYFANTFFFAVKLGKTDSLRAFLMKYGNEQSQKLGLPPSAGSLCSCRQCRSLRTCSCARTPGH